MIYLDEAGAFYAEDYEKLVAARCDAHVGAYNLHKKMEREIAWKEQQARNAELAKEYW